jgi:hypothetical protein
MLLLRNCGFLTIVDSTLNIGEKIVHAHLSAPMESCYKRFERGKRKRKNIKIVEKTWNDNTP